LWSEGEELWLNTHLAPSLIAKKKGARRGTRAQLLQHGHPHTREGGVPSFQIQKTTAEIFLKWPSAQDSSDRSRLMLRLVARDPKRYVEFVHQDVLGHGTSVLMQ
jgi:hypothetical protein